MITSGTYVLYIVDLLFIEHTVSFYPAACYYLLSVFIFVCIAGLWVQIKKNGILTV